MSLERSIEEKLEQDRDLVAPFDAEEVHRTIQEAYAASRGGEEGRTRAVAMLEELKERIAGEVKSVGGREGMGEEERNAYLRELQVYDELVERVLREEVR